ncbi:MAG: 1-acyl-sn-glycerol-3-phosphate acyltransferase [Anaerolineae bacterium]|nr:1-acyl-sn-glycerol-3-phosphate acyltransferase [Anaerolineae bacterium]
MTSVSTDFPNQQQRYTAARRLMRDVGLQTIVFHTIISVKVQGMEHIPPDGPTIVMMNHMGGLDPIVVMGAVEPRFIVPMSKLENFNIPILGWLMKLWGAYPIRRGEVDRAALQNTVDLLKGGNLVLMAPEGTRQPQMSEGKDGITYVAVKANAAIVPVGIEGTREFIPNLTRLRRSHITLNFGRAFRFKTDGRERIPRAEMSRMTQEAMYQLAMRVAEHRRGFYRDLSQATTDTLEFIS